MLRFGLGAAGGSGQQKQSEKRPHEEVTVPPVTAYRLRWGLLVLALICLAAGLWWIAGPLLYGDADEGTTRTALPLGLLTGLTELDSDMLWYWIHLALFLGALLLTQWMFLLPRQGWTVRLSESARPMRTAVVAAAFLAMMLSLGGIATLLELVGLWDDVIDDDRWVAVTVSAWIVWVLWAGVFYAFWRKGTRFEQLRTMAHGLIVGSILELFVATGFMCGSRTTRTAGAHAGPTRVWCSAPRS